MEANVFIKTEESEACIKEIEEALEETAQEITEEELKEEKIKEEN